MVLWGLSLLLVSLSFIAYRHGSTFWAKFPWISGHIEARQGEQEQLGNPEPGDRGREGRKYDQTPVMKANSSPSIIADSSAEPKSPDSTPKARSTKLEPDVPSFTLDGSSEMHRKDFVEPPDTALSRQTPSSSSTTRGPPTLKPLPNEAKPSASELMPPPRAPLPRRATPAAAQAARVPTTGPLPNRGPSTTRPTNSLAVPGAATVPTLNSRNKVTLAPGRSSIDWAQMTKTNRNLAGVPYLQRVTPSQLKQMNGRKGRPVWASYQGRVYNLTPYVPYHPGGEGEIMRAAGKDAEKLFNEIHAYVNWENMLGSCCVGIMVTENEEQARGKTDWEAMD